MHSNASPAPVSAGLRFLIATHAPLSPRHGAAQLALNLGEALQARGHHVTFWSPHPLGARGRWWNKMRAMRRKFEEFVDGQPAFDVIDAPAPLITGRVRRQSFIVVRSVQPDLPYLLAGLWESPPRSIGDGARALERCVHAIYHACIVLRGWSMADLIICLGQLELRWMNRHFPRWSGKLRSYVAALSTLDQQRLEDVRAKRASHVVGRPIRFLWIGRWVRHKGNGTLLQFMRRWLAEHPQDSFTIAGCGALSDGTFAGALAESSQVRIEPAYERNGLASLLSAHDVGLFTSKVEGWGVALNEMLESGMPVFATCAGGVPDLEPFFATRMRRFPPDRNGLEAGSAAAPDWTRYYEVFSWRAIADRYLEAVQEARARRAWAMRQTT